MTNTNRRPELPAMPSASKPRRLKACYCGCGGTTASTFVPGHDSTLKAWVLRAERGVDIGALDEFPNMKKRVAEMVAMRAKGTNPSFMRNVELPTRADATKTA